MSIVLNLIVLLIIGYCIYRGYRNGIIVSVVTVIVIVFSIYMASLLANVYSGDFKGMFRPFAGGIVDNAFSVVMSDSRDEAEEPVVVLTDGEKSNVRSVAFATLRQLGISEPASTKIADRVSGQVQNVGQKVSEAVTEELCHTLAYLMIFSIAFMLISIVFAVLGNVLNLKFALPGLEIVNGAVGAAIGLVQGVIVVMLLACLFRYAGVILSEEKIHAAKLLNWLVESNPIAGLLGI